MSPTCLARSLVPKASSVPPLSSASAALSSLDYDQLLSASSSRSESPLSERGCFFHKCSSLLSLNGAARYVRRR
jgi:hypothetical protein